MAGSICISGCQQKATEYSDTPTSGTIRMSADETFRPVLDAEQAVFESLYAYAKVNIDYKTETESLNDLFHDSTHLIVATRPLNANEMAFFEQKKLFPKSILIAKDAIALLVNPENTDTLISVEQFKQVLTGKINDWKQLSGSKQKGSVTLVFDNKNSSTIRYMLDSVCGKCEISNSHIALESNLQVIEYIKKNPNAIGIIGVSWISDRDDPKMLSFLKEVKVMRLSSDSIPTLENSCQPFQAFIWDGSYPFTRNVYLINSEPRKGLATGFAAFIASDKGQRIILKTGILPANQPFRTIKVKDNF